ncbi:response regulator transcription factor [Sphingomonas sp.]|uniref:response regulator transcription factor n=1 Tax=Sphingomonas sp. TaxID=28214 RepID=UPI002E11513F|nr:response regulator transcription factor [Sphingomonas sp.]
MNLRFLIVDDHPICRTAAELIVRASYPDAHITIAGCLREALGLADHPDVILLDLLLPDSSGVATVTAVTKAFPLAKVIVITAAGADETDKLETRNVFGPIAKSAPMSTLARAIHRAIADTSQNGGSDILLLESIDERVATLTNAERKILEAMSSGHQNKQIAFAVGLSEATVKQHIKAILRKLGASNRTQAILMSLSGAPDPSDPN